MDNTETHPQTEAEKVAEYRIAMFEEMGFSKVRAKVLCEAKGSDGWPLSTHAIRQMLNDGCAHELALKILL